MTDRTPTPDRLLLTQSVRDHLFAHARTGVGSGRGEHPGSTEASDEASVAAENATVEVCGVLGGRTDVETSADAGEKSADGDAGATDDGDGGSADHAAGEAADGETVARVTAIRHVPNVAADARFRYELDPAATVEAIDALEAEGLTHVGFYHSHPNGPRGPSRTDEASATWPGYVYLIVSLAADPAIGAWRWTGEAFVQLPIEVE